MILSEFSLLPRVFRVTLHRNQDMESSCVCVFVELAATQPRLFGETESVISPDPALKGRLGSPCHLPRTPVVKWTGQ